MGGKGVNVECEVVWFGERKEKNSEFSMGRHAVIQPEPQFLDMGQAHKLLDLNSSRRLRYVSRMRGHSRPHQLRDEAPGLAKDLREPPVEKSAQCNNKQRNL